MKVFVTGGCGFLGSHVCEYFIDQGWEAISYDSLTKYELRRTGYATEKARMHNWDFLKSIGTKLVEAD
ncbi:MAG: NAD-dependent epimerase/dehydratase family protein, partial [Nitrososphaeria archaeon]|nr:NAD-dependent epimerase/dehydratase family protein [Nitrososphaeria archaeon]NIQ32584.1 NAD-dependent epimerase/dehydratase family protein [Nitrososphaeria archaeon]